MGTDARTNQEVPAQPQSYYLFIGLAWEVQLWWMAGATDGCMHKHPIRNLLTR
jgi:hypothetical protein